MKSKAVIIAQSGIGRSDPQIVYLANSLKELNFSVTLIQCIHPCTQKSATHLLDQEIFVQSHYPTVEMWSKAGFSEFALFSAWEINEIKPDYVFSFDYAGVLSISLARELSTSNFRSCIFMLENIEYMQAAHGANSIKDLEKIWKDSYIIYPEINRLISDLTLYSTHLPLNKKIFITSPTSPHECSDSKNIVENTSNHITDKKIKILYAGSIVNESFAIDFGWALLKSEIEFQYDLFGPVGDSEQVKLKNLIEKSASKITYNGIINQKQLAEIYSTYDYGFTGWRPVSSNYYYACPNKFFQTVKHCITPITTKHPIINNIINSFNLFCIDLPWDTNDWHQILKGTLKKRHQQKKEITLNYQIFKKHLSWQAQFADLSRFLEIVSN